MRQDSLRTVQHDSVQPFLERTYFLNTVTDYLVAVTIICVGIIVFKTIRQVLVRKFGQLDNLYIMYFLKLERYLSPIVILLILFFAFHTLLFSGKVEKTLSYAFTVGFIFLSIRLITAAVRNAIHSYFSHQDETGGKLKQIRGIVIILNGLLWLVGLIFLFDNLGFNVTAVLTGLGVGGIAIALAAQTILGDLFNYFVIFFDQPFELGDFIIVDDKLGTVEYIGLKTTRVKSLQGEQIIFSNSNLTGSRIHNYKKMLERRTLFKIGVVYHTTKEKLIEIPQIIRSIIEEQEGVRFDRAHFISYGDYSLNFEIVYYVMNSDYNRYADVQQAINLRIFEEFQKRDIEFAFPTYSIYMRDAAGLEHLTQFVSPAQTVSSRTSGRS